MEGADSVLLVEAPSLNRQPLPLAENIGSDVEGILKVWGPLMAMGRRPILLKRVLSKSEAALLLVCFDLFLIYLSAAHRSSRESRPVS